MFLLHCCWAWPWTYFDHYNVSKQRHCTYCAVLHGFHSSESCREQALGSHYPPVWALKQDMWDRTKLNSLPGAKPSQPTGMRINVPGWKSLSFGEVCYRALSWQKRSVTDRMAKLLESQLRTKGLSGPSKSHNNIIYNKLLCMYVLLLQHKNMEISVL